MAETVTCTICNNQMSKIGTLNSGNSQFLEYVCKSCWQKKTICVGASPILS